MENCHSLLQAEKAERREKNLEEAKKITIEQDPSLPAPKQVSACWLHFFALSVTVSEGIWGLNLWEFE